MLTEAFHFLEGTRERQELWKFLLSGALTWADIQRVELARMNTLMMKYADLPMDLADASLVVVAERLKLRKVFTLDRRDFRLYRGPSKSSLDTGPYVRYDALMVM